MQLLSYFLRKYRFFLFFLLLEFVAIFLIIQNHSFHKSKFIDSTNSITGGFYQKKTDLKDYLTLKEENTDLIKENVALKQEIQDLKEKILLDSLATPNFTESKYVFRTSRIIKNSYNSSYNFLLINSGIKDSMKPEMAVVNHKGIIGVTEKSSQNYTRVQSILNLESNINAKLKKENYYGSLTWDGKNYRVVQLVDIERQAPIQIGDTIVTGERSTIFPEGIPIGKVISFNQERTTKSVIEVELFNDMSNLKSVFIIENKHQQEIKNLENSNE